ncbi:MAG: glycosyl transferase family 28 [Flavobacteriales bacterium]|nr:MAG: glycosyl transferase family 28 [Flavobacteriales bacterium]
MIFITIGTQEPFDRLIKAMDEVANLFPEKKFYAQVSDTSYKALHLKTQSFLAPAQFNRLFNEAELIISHAGMGTIISALTQKKPILVVPRLVKFGEHRNEHQLATAKKMEELGYVRVAYDIDALKNEVINLLRQTEVKPLRTLGNFASPELLNSLKGLASSVKS